MKQCENLKRELKVVNTCCFSTIPVKVFAKKKNQILKVVLALEYDVLLTLPFYHNSNK